MNKMKIFFKMWLTPLLLIILIAGCDDRLGITTPLIITTPTVTSTNPTNSSTSVPSNIQVTATFSAAMDSSTITTATFTLMQGTSFVSGTVSYTGRTATFSPSSNLTPNTVYTATITTGAKNVGGGALVKNYVWSFTTASTVLTLPSVSSTDPVNAATNIPINQKIAATFNVVMDASSITASTVTLMQGTTAVSGFVSYSGTTAIIAPSNNLVPNTKYTVTITMGAKDLNGNSLANNYVWNFTTGIAVLITSPEVSSTDPINAATGVPLNQKIAATFSKTMDASTITTSTFTLVQGSNSVPGFVSYSGTTAIFAPSNNLLPNTAYSVMITTGAKDLAGNALANNFMWSFTTGAAAVIIPPAITNTNPANSEIGVALNQKIAATFSKTMDATTIQTSTFTLMQGTTVVTGFVSYSGTTANFSPESNLSPNTLYTATVTTGAKDLAGNALASNYVWTFTTGAAVVLTSPTVILTDPLNVATGVALNQKIAASFSKTMDATTLTSATFTLKQGTTSVSGFVSYSGITAIFAPASNLLPSTVYTATITTGAEDLGGNALANNYVWSFTTGAAVIVIPPTVISTDPVDAATGVALTKQITATFSTTMDASTLTTSSFTVKQGLTSVSGFVSYSGTTATFAPASNLEPNTLYTATITNEAKDLAGNALANNYVWKFTTGASVVVVPPTVILTDPLNHAIDVALNKQIAATFSRTMDASTFTSATFTLKQGTTPIPGFISYSGTTAIFAPTANLVANTLYTATITVGARDLSGISLTSNYVWSFTTLQPFFAVSLSSNPVDGGNTNGGGSFISGSPVTVTATPNTGYTFTNWTENGNPVSTNANYQFTISGNRTLVAHFAINSYTLTVTAVNGTVNKNPNQTNYNYGSDVVLTANPASGYLFTGWSGDATGSTNPLTVTMNANKNITANFAKTGPAGVDLGSAGNFAILAGSGVTNTGALLTHIYGDVGAFPTATINGLLAANVTGTLYTSADPIVGTAKTALTAAYNDAQGRSLDAISLPGQLGGLTLAPGLYVNSSSTGISGTGSNAILTLDAGGNPNAVWIFKMGSTLITDPGTSIVLAGGASWDNIYWSVGTSATLGTNSIFYGNILADQSITLTTGATLKGRALTRVAAVTLDSNIVDKRP